MAYIGAAYSVSQHSSASTCAFFAWAANNLKFKHTLSSLQQNWTYERGGTDLQAKLGALLTNGADLQVCMSLLAVSRTQNITHYNG